MSLHVVLLVVREVSPVYDTHHGNYITGCYVLNTHYSQNVRTSGQGERRRGGRGRELNSECTVKGRDI